MRNALKDFGSKCKNITIQTKISRYELSDIKKSDDFPSHHLRKHFIFKLPTISFWSRLGQFSFLWVCSHFSIWEGAEFTALKRSLIYQNLLLFSYKGQEFCLCFLIGTYEKSKNQIICSIWLSYNTILYNE